MLTNKYLATVRNFQDIMKKIVEETPPEKFTIAYLKHLGFKSSNDYRVIRLLKDIGFLTESGNPTHIYYVYRIPYLSRRLLGNIVIEMYEDIFLLLEEPKRKDSPLIRELFKSTHGVSDQIALFMTNTFFALFELSDVSYSFHSTDKRILQNYNNMEMLKGVVNDEKDNSFVSQSNYGHTIELHLPLSKDKEVYDLIFSSLREQLFKEL
jgi:hypothetical protein